MLVMEGLFCLMQSFLRLTIPLSTHSRWDLPSTAHPGTGNHLSFLLFLIFQCIHLSMAFFLLLFLALPSFLAHSRFDRGVLGLLGGFTQLFFLAAPPAMLERPLSSCLLFLVGLLWAFSHAALAAQLKVVAKNLLTVEMRDRRGPNPFDRGCCLNVISFISLFYHHQQERRDLERRQRAHNDGFALTSFPPSWPSAPISSSASSTSPSPSSSPGPYIPSPSCSPLSQASPFISPTASPTASLLPSTSIDSSHPRGLPGISLGASHNPSLLVFFRKMFPFSRARRTYPQNQRSCYQPTPSSDEQITPASRIKTDIICPPSLKLAP